MKPRSHSPRLSVLVAGGSAPMRDHLRALLNREPGLCLCGEADTGATALELFFQFQPDVVVVNALLPDRSGFKVVETMKQTAPASQAVLLCHAADPCVEEVARMVGANYVCANGGELAPILELLRALAARSVKGWRADLRPDTQPQC